MIVPPTPAVASLPPQRDIEVAAMRRTAEALEAHFLAEVLKSAGLNETGSGFGGGAGEDQFASFLIQAQAERIARAGGIGLAEAFFNAMANNERA